MAAFGSADVSAERLPKGFTRRASGSLRVQIRMDGHLERRHFPLLADTAADRRRQLADAEAWASETRRRIVGGAHVSHHEAEHTTLATCLQRYEREGLIGDPANVAKELPRIAVLLKDPIARKTLAQLRKTDIVALRDRLLHAGWLRKVESRAKRVEREDRTDAGRRRCAEIRALPSMAAKARETEGPPDRSLLEDEVARISTREGIKFPARTTIANVVQLVTRALKHASQTIDGVPDLTGVPMPKGSPGRDRRILDEELRLLIDHADVRLSLIIRFAIATALRRERLLTCRTSHIRAIGKARFAIVFPRATAVRKKRTGIIPVTKEIRGMIDEALRIQGVVSLESAPDMPLFDLALEAFESQWKRLVAATGIEDLTFHDTRHEATSRLFERGLSTAEVMSITGHSTQEMVDRYSHYSAALVLEKLERGSDAAGLLAEIGFLISQFQAAGGDISEVHALSR